MPDKMGKDIDIKEIQKDLSDYLTKKYGRKIQFAGFGPIPETAGEKVEEGEKEKEPGLSAIHFDMKPEELKAYLDEYLVRQDDVPVPLSPWISIVDASLLATFLINSRTSRMFSDTPIMRSTLNSLRWISWVRATSVRSRRVSNAFRKAFSSFSKLIGFSMKS